MAATNLSRLPARIGSFVLFGFLLVTGARADAGAPSGWAAAPHSPGRFLPRKPPATLLERIGQPPATAKGAATARGPELKSVAPSAARPGARFRLRFTEPLPKGWGVVLVAADGRHHRLRLRARAAGGQVDAWLPRVARPGPARLLPVGPSGRRAGRGVAFRVLAAALPGTMPPDGGGSGKRRPSGTLPKVLPMPPRAPSAGTKDAQRSRAAVSRGVGTTARLRGGFGFALPKEPVSKGKTTVPGVRQLPGKALREAREQAAFARDRKAGRAGAALGRGGFAGHGRRAGAHAKDSATGRGALDWRSVLGPRRSAGGRRVDAGAPGGPGRAGSVGGLRRAGGGTRVGTGAIPSLGWTRDDERKGGSRGTGVFGGIDAKRDVGEFITEVVTNGFDGRRDSPWIQAGRVVLGFPAIALGVMGAYAADEFDHGLNAFTVGAGIVRGICQKAGACDGPTGTAGRSGESGQDAGASGGAGSDGQASASRQGGPGPGARQPQGGDGTPQQGQRQDGEEADGGDGGQSQGGDQSQGQGGSEDDGDDSGDDGGEDGTGEEDTPADEGEERTATTGGVSGGACASPAARPEEGCSAPLPEFGFGPDDAEEQERERRLEAVLGREQTGQPAPERDGADECSWDPVNGRCRQAPANTDRSWTVDPGGDGGLHGGGRPAPATSTPLERLEWVTDPAAGSGG